MHKFQQRGISPANPVQARTFATPDTSSLATIRPLHGSERDSPLANWRVRNLWFEVGWVQLIRRVLLKAAHFGVPTHLNGHTLRSQLRVQIGQVNCEAGRAVATFVCEFHIKTKRWLRVDEIDSYVTSLVANVVFKSQQVTPSSSFLLDNEPVPNRQFVSSVRCIGQNGDALDGAEVKEVSNFQHPRTRAQDSTSLIVAGVFVGSKLLRLTRRRNAEQ